MRISTLSVSLFALLFAACGPDDGQDAFDDVAVSVDEVTARPGSSVVERTYRVLHWNIAGGKEHNCRLDGIKRAVVRIASERDIDFIGLNEVCPNQYAAIRDTLERRWGKQRTFSAFVRGGRVGNAIFSRFALKDITRQEIGEDRYGKRNLLCGKVRDLPHLRFCSTHLSPNSRARTQLDRVFNRLETWWRQRNDTVILSGDFNLEPNDRAFNDVYAPGANHPRNNPNNHGRYRELDDADKEHCRGYGERSVPRTGGGPCGEGRRIDLIFTRANRIVDNRYFSNSLNIPSDCTGVCSDHRPVIGQVRVKVKR